MAFFFFRRVYRRRPRRTRSGAQYRIHKEAARAFIHERLAVWSAHYGFDFKRVAIRDQKSRWGSCSVHKNLNFNYRLLFLPPELADYVIVHELCHLEEFNHSPRFWALVEKGLPDYRERKAALRRAYIGNVGPRSLVQ